jgi:CRP-like cAMP-binding protein
VLRSSFSQSKVAVTGFDVLPNNNLLRSLSDARNTVPPRFRRVELSLNSVIYEPGVNAKSIYFPETSVISFLGNTQQGNQIEVWSVGEEGFAGINAIHGATAPYRAVVLVPGTALVTDVPTIRKHIFRDHEFCAAVLTYCERLVNRVAQLGLCNSVHPVEQRLCRWLLSMQDHIGSNTLVYTHDFIAYFLGIRRASVSVAAASLQRSGFIRYSAGSITILSRRGLLKSVCACYQRVRRLAGTPKRLSHSSRSTAVHERS